MTHLANGPTVSLEEAQRIERETAQHLLKSRKLSLIVDLDQTIVHATVDPTVGEWIAEGEPWEARQAAKAAKASDGSGDTTKEKNGDEEAGSESDVTQSDDEEDEGFSVVFRKVEAGDPGTSFGVLNNRAAPNSHTLPSHRAFTHTRLDFTNGKKVLLF